MDEILNGKQVLVVDDTGVARLLASDILGAAGMKIIEAETTVVYPRKLTDAQIASHIKSGIWRNKAGAYSISDNDPFVDHIDGSMTNVMGMPMELFKKLLF